MPSVIVSTKGWVVVPKEYRLKYGLKPGAKVQIIDYGGACPLFLW
jgi:AbrB family looped-hinge helix DNA binding protein